MISKQAKRFYKEASAVTLESGFGVTLDGRDLKSPAKADLIVPTKALADVITDEFNAQEDSITPETMPIFSLASTVVDRILPQRATLDDELVRYGLNDLISYHVEAEEDEVLAARQIEIWGQIHLWLEKSYQVKLETFKGIMPQTQPPHVAEKLPSIIRPIDDWLYLALYRATTLSGSLALGLAFQSKYLDVEALMSHAYLDELYQEEKWGTDEWAVERRDNVKKEFDDMWNFLKLL